MHKYTLHTWFNFNNLASMPGRNVEMIVWMKLQVQKLHDISCDCITKAVLRQNRSLIVKKHDNEC